MAVTPEEIARAVDILVGGGVVAFPTETVYGLGALASRGDAVDRIFAMKGRPRSRALIVHLADASAMDTYAEDVPDYARRLADHFWPGPLTLVLRRRPTVIDEVTGGGDTVALRVPAHPVALDLLRALAHEAGAGAAIAAPSANRFGEPPALTAAEVIRNLGEPGTDHAPDLVLDGGPCPGKLPSTILSCLTDPPRLLRHGALDTTKIETILTHPITR